MKQELSAAQIEHLFDFVKSKYVRYIDVQHELVDHLATAIEEEMELNPNLNYYQALDKVYSHFPITGFVHFVAEKEKGVRRYWQRKIFNYFLDYLKLPKIVLLIGICGLNYLLLQAFSPYGLLVLLSAYFGFTIITHIINFRFFKSMSLCEKDYLVISTYKSLFYNVGFPPIFLIYFGDHLDFIEPQVLTTWYSILVSVVLGIMGIWNMASLTDFPKMLKEDLEQKYHHLDLKLS